MPTLISWTDETWNPLVGCSKISAGCSRCYAAEAAKSARLQQFPQYQKVSDWDGTIEFVENQLLKPLSWRSPKKVFVCSMSDIFHANVKDEWLDKIFAVMAIASHHTFQILTKRPEQMREYFQNNPWERIYQLIDSDSKTFPTQKYPNLGILLDSLEKMVSTSFLPNIWVGTTVENQKTANDRIPHLLQTPATKLFLSCEPLLECVSLDQTFTNSDGEQSTWLSSIDQVIIGGESGPGARGCELDWIRFMVNQCQRASDVAIFVKQLGSNPIQTACYIHGVVATYQKLKLKDKKGGTIDEFPQDLRIRQFPTLAPSLYS
ncbi:phage Gp37/Gp68 family protein [Microcoleus sp. F10-C6]|uniref:phage Gp37/Gp68 family protein n=1 Tax=unclassified Microcoleus TaxID=2642155 RepID=UPI002FD57016